MTLSLVSPLQQELPPSSWIDSDGSVRIGPGRFEPSPLVVSIGPYLRAWAEANLLQPDGPDAGEPWAFTEEQAHFIDHWYSIGPDGRFIWRRGVLRRMKGWGKDPLLAVICAIELCAECRAKVTPAGEIEVFPHPAPWIQIAAVSKDQTRNTMTLFPSLFSPELIAEQGLDIGKEIIHKAGGRGRIEAVTSSPRALEGGRPSFVVKNETQHWLQSNDGHAMSEAIDRNLAKSRDGAARALAITNAHEPGLDSDAERDFDAHMKIASGRSRASGFLYDSREAHPDTIMSDPASLTVGLEQARGDSVWLDVARLIDEIFDPKTSEDLSRRFYLNQIAAARDSWLSRQEVDRNAVRRLLPSPGSSITLAFDGGKTDDHTALVACEVDSGWVWPVGIWDPSDYGGTAPTALIDQTVRSVFDAFDVVAFFSDLHPWESYVDAWAADFGETLSLKASPKHSIAWDMRGRGKDFTIAAEGAHSAFLDNAFPHSGDVTLSQHLYNARRAPNAWGVSIRKEHRESARKIDAAVAAILAREARLQYLRMPESRRKRRRTGKAAFA